MDDPKRRAKSAVADFDEETAGEDLQSQVAALQATVNALLSKQATGLTEDRLEAILTRVAQISADAQERAANPSNKTHPAISVYSYPEGDRARPRPDLKCQTLWAGYEIDKDTTTAEEIELFNQAVPGVFTFQRTDGSPEQLHVIGSTDPAGNLSRLEFRFQAKENRDTLPSMVAMLRQAYKIKSPEQLELEALRAEVERLKRA